MIEKEKEERLKNCFKKKKTFDQKSVCMRSKMTACSSPPGYNING